MTIYHKHHIIPKHMGGTDDPSNLVEVTIEEHANLHKQLWEELGNWQDKVAWQMLSGQITIAQAIKETQRNYMKNRVISEETRKKMAEGTKRRLQRQGHHMLGKKFSEASKKKMSESHIGQVPWNKGRIKTDEEKNKDKLAQYKVTKYECQYCGKLCRGLGNLKQHLDKHYRNQKTGQSGQSTYQYW